MALKKMTDAQKNAIKKMVAKNSKVNLDNPKPKPKPTATKKAAPKPSASSKLGPLPKNPTLNDYLIRGLKVPIAPGQKKLPSDSDVKPSRRTR